jgi:hypothetical protein
MRKHTGIWSVQEYQEEIEDCVRKGCLPQLPRNELLANWIYKVYREINHKQAKHALLIQLAEVLVALRLRNPAKRFGNILAKAGIEKSFAQELLVAYTNPKEKWGPENE